jgi:hypothetical protein
MAAVGLAFAGCGASVANPIPPGYQDLPVAPSEFVAQVPTPLIADDFEPAFNGPVAFIEWWGSLSAGPWQLTLYSNADPDPTTPDDGGSSIVVEPYRIQQWNSDIFYYAADLSGADWRLTRRNSYWLGVASFESGWTWALGDGQPEFGWQQQRAVGSFSDGAWLPLDPLAQLAFGVWPTLVREPGTGMLIAIGLLGLGVGRRWFKPLKFGSPRIKPGQFSYMVPDMDGRVGQR